MTIGRRPLVTGLVTLAGLAGSRQGSVSQYPSRTQAVNANVPAEVVWIQTLGYRSPGDGGGAKYRRVPTQPRHVYGLTSADGSGWLIEEPEIDIRMGGALSDADDAAIQNTAAVVDALSLAPTVVPRGDFALLACRLPSGARLRGTGFGSRLRAVHSTNDNWINCIGVSDIEIRDLWLDANRRGRLNGFVATGGAGISIGYDALVPEPGASNVRIRACKITGAGFVGIFTHNAHNVQILDNQVIGDTDSGIACCAGSSNIRVERNYCEGWLFGISMSSDGLPDDKLKVVGPVRNWIISDNIILNTQTNGYGLQFDGVRDFTITRNRVTIDGGLFGLRFYGSRGKGVSGQIDCHFGSCTGNIVEVKANNTSSAFELWGAGDVTDIEIKHNAVISDGQRASAYGVTLLGGARVKMSGFSIQNVGTGVYIEPNNLATRIELSGFVVSGCYQALDCTSESSGRTELRLDRFEASNSTASNLSIGRLADITLQDTPVRDPSYVATVPKIIG